MKVHIGGYTSWFGPYQLAEKLMFWVPKEKDEWGFPHTADRVHNFGEWLAYGSIRPEPEVGEVHSWNDNRKPTLLYRFLLWIEGNKKRKIDVRIDRYDTWNMNNTLAYIILPMLKQLKETKHGSPYVDDKDVPKELRSTSAPPKENEWDIDENHHARWDYVLDEMIWAFTQINNEDDAESQFFTSEGDPQWEKLEDGNYRMLSDPTASYDKKGHTAWKKRKAKGLMLFGKYYEGLWD